MRFLVLLIKFLFLGFFFIVSTLNLPIFDNDNLNTILGEYKNWISSVGKEVGTLGSYVIKVEWLPRTEKTSQDIELEPEEGPKYSQVRR